MTRSLESSRLTPGCSCGAHRNPGDHDAAMDRALVEQSGVLQGALMRALFPRDAQRRNFLRAVGVPTAAAVLSEFFPPLALQALAQAAVGPLERKTVNLGFLPIVCATPMIYAHEAGIFAKEGLSATLLKTGGWALIRDKTLAGEYDGALMLSPMPLAISLGLTGEAVPVVVPALSNTNGSAITLHVKHKNNRDPRNWKGFRIGIPYEYSMQNFLLRLYLAKYGIDPNTDVQLRVMPPPDMIANMKADSLDAFILAEPFSARAVYEEIGFTQILTSDLWDGHPCCSFAFTGGFAQKNPNTFGAIVRSLMRAAEFANLETSRKPLVPMIAKKEYLNQPEIVVEQGLTGRFADGLGNIRYVPNRVSFDSFPWDSMAVWMLTQMKAMGYLKASVNYRQVAEQVYLASDARRRLTALDIKAPAENYREHTVLGKPFRALAA